MSTAQRVLWFIGGFDSRILEMDACRSVRAKYSCIAGLVLMTAVLAVCSGGYALYTIFNRLDVSLVIGALWGLFIFTVDRFLVTSNRKLAISEEFYSTSHSTPPYKERHSVAGHGGLAIRLLLAAAIGLVVAKPIEMLILQPWIQEHESDKNAQTRNRVFNESSLGRIDAEILRLEKVLDGRRGELARKREVLSREVNGERGSAMIGRGVIFRTEQELLLKAEQGYEQDLAHLVAARRNRDGEMKRAGAGADSLVKEREERHSIISDLGAVHEIKKGGDVKADLVALVSLFLTCFFVIIEITPVLAKVISPFDPYDALLLQEEHASILRELGKARDSHKNARVPNTTT